jgi:ligand-binding sensor domain-containing protein/signal transduction histidine kinase
LFIQNFTLLFKPVFRLVLLLLFPVVATSQPVQPATATSPVLVNRSESALQTKQYVFTHYSSFNGLASNIVNGIIQDRKGYMWLATLDGLQRFDGNKFMTFRNQAGNPSSIPSDVVTHLMEDKKGNLWIGGDNKVGIFNTDSYTFTEVPIEGGRQTPEFYVQFMTEDADGNVVLYIGKTGLFTYNKAKGIFQLAYPFNLPIEYHYIGFFHDPATSQYWYSCIFGLCMFDTQTKHLNYRGHNIDNNPVIQQLAYEEKVISVFGWQGDLFWYATWQENDHGAPFYEYLNIKTGEKKQFSMDLSFNIGYSEVGGMLTQKNGHAWFYGTTYLAEYPGKGQPQLINTEYKDEQSIKFKRAITMCEDRQHNIWVATDNGVFLFNPEAQLFNSYKLVRTDRGGSINGPTSAALQLKDSRILIGTWGGGVYLYDADFKPLPFPPQLHKYIEPYSIWCIVQHSVTGKVWMGMQAGAMLLYDPPTGKVDYFTPDAINGSTIRQVTEDKYGNLWFGMQRGHVVKWDAKAANYDYRKGYKVVKAPDSVFINKMYTDKEGYVWAASTARGLYKFNPVTDALEEHFTTEGKPGERIWSNNTTDILQYNDSVVLIAGGAINMYNIKTHKISILTSENGLPSNTVNSFIKDLKGSLWLGLAHGLCRANLEKKIFSRYDRRDGITYDNFPPASAFRLLDGRLMFATDVGYTVFNPDRFMESPVPDNVIITDIKIANNSIPVDSAMHSGHIDLKYNNSSLAVEFNSLNFLKQNKLHYFYMLEGLEKDWHEASDLNHAVYNFLAPGKYTFKVKAENSDGRSSATITVFNIHVSPPFWESWWFYGIIVLVAAGFLYWMDRERVKRLLAMQQMRTQIAGNLHEEINTTLGNINMLSEMAKIKADKDITRSKEYIDQISEKSNKMIIAMDDMLWSINPANDNMEVTILRMKEFTEAMINRHGAKIHLGIDKDVYALKLDMKSRHEFFLVFKEALQTMMPYTEGDQILVNINLVRPRLYLNICDTGKEAKQLLLSNTAIQQMKKRAESIKASLDFQTDNKSVSVVLTIPVK